MRSLNSQPPYLAGQLLLNLTFCIVLPAVAHGATYYVSKTGSDSNTCIQALTPSTAKLRIAAGIACMSGGDSLIIGDGVYAENVSNTIPAGSSVAPTIIQALNRNQAVVRPSGTLDVFQIGNDYITIDGIDADAVNAYGSPYQMYNGGRGVSHLVLKNGTARNGHGNVSSSSGIMGNMNDSQILNMDVYGNGTGTNQDHGIYQGGARAVIDGNRVHNNGAYGIHVYSGGGGVNNNIIRNNAIWGNVLRGVIISSGTGNQFYNNLVYGNGQGIEVGGIGNLIVNNTIYNNRLICIWVTSGSSHTIQNNICYLNAANNIQNDGGAIIADHNFFTDPLFVNAAIADFRLTAASGAIDAGTTINEINRDFLGTSRPQGGAPDFGAFEYVSGGQSSPPSSVPAP
jgi:hypothetical protein